MCLDDALDYDFFEGALDVSGMINTCSPDKAFTTIGASPDKNAGTCHTNGGPHLNRWFKFTAPQTGAINATVKVGGPKGTQRRTQAALWEADGTTEISCKNFNYTDEDVSVGAHDLVPGNTYYLSVDVFNYNFSGTFTLCLSETVDYDYYEGAIELANLDNWCSADAAYTTIGATSDQNPGSCWNNAGPRQNRWFKFTAINNNVTITVNVGGSKGTQRRTQLALWEADGATQVDCAGYQYGTADDVTISNDGLTAGNLYYISVDVFQNYGGTFSLCIDNVDQTYYSIASGNWNDTNNWSLVGHTGLAAPNVPNIGDAVYIKGHQMTVNTDENPAAVYINVASAATGLTITNATLNISGPLTVTNNGAPFDCNVLVKDYGKLLTNSDATFARKGGSEAFGLTIESTGSMQVNRSMVWTSTGGDAQPGTMVLNGNAVLNINEDLILSHLGGTKTLQIFNGSSILNVRRDISFSAIERNMLELRFNDNTRLHIGRDIKRGATPYGILNFTGNSTVSFNGATYQQHIPGNVGAAGDFIAFENVELNNTALPKPEFILDGSTSVSGRLRFINGIMKTTSTKLLTLTETSIPSGYSSKSYINGPLAAVVATTAPRLLNFPTGNDVAYRPMEMSVIQTTSTPTIYTAEYVDKPAGKSNTQLPPSLDRVSVIGYWNIEKGPGSSISLGKITLSYYPGDGVTDPINLRIAQDDGDKYWIDLGGMGTGAPAGTITTTNNFTSFGNFSLANARPGINPLPIELLDFDAKSKNGKVYVEWMTASENNNDYFTVEKSFDGRDYQTVVIVKGAGNGNAIHEYNAVDKNPYVGTSYYRLKQTDFDGNYTYSKTVAVNHEMQSQAKIYPNPTTGQSFYIELEGNRWQEMEITIYSPVGGMVYSTILTEQDGTMTAAIALPKKLTPGVYLVVGRAGSEAFRTKLVVRH